MELDKDDHPVPAGKKRWWRNLADDRQLLTWVLVLVVVSILFSLFTVYDQITERTGIEFLLTKQLRRHREVVEGRSFDPWQYRIFGDYLVAAVIKAARWLGVGSVEIRSFALVRLAQNFLIFIVAAVYWGRLGLRRMHTLVALAFLAWGISYSGYGSGLAFSTYFDVLFYLLAAIIILSGRYFWLIPVMVLAAINQETSGLIPFMLAAVALKPPAGQKLNRKVLTIAGICLLIYVLEYGLLRLVFGLRELSTPYGEELGFNLVVFNLTSAKTYSFVFATLSIVPLVALFYWKRWPEILKRFFWAVVPVWLGVHLFLGVLAESRLLLVPQVVVFLPAALLAVQKEAQ
jgi:hypothetical protein